MVARTSAARWIWVIWRYDREDFDPVESLDKGRRRRLLSLRHTEGGVTMLITQADDRSPQRRAADERLAAEAMLPRPEMPADTPIRPMEHCLEGIRRKPMAVEGVVENGLVRPLDPDAKLPENARVIIVAAGDD